MLQGYWDTQLLDLVKYRFPLDFNRNTLLKCVKINHKSALLYPNDIEAYLNEERQYGTILGPFENFPIDQCHPSPFMTREKPNAVHRRVIIDLPWPKGASVNSGTDKNSYLGTDFVLTFPTVDHITSEIKKIGPGAHLYEIDISRVFRPVAVDPMIWTCWVYLGMEMRSLKQNYHLGVAMGCKIFSVSVRHIMHRHGFTVINYVDDFIGVATPSVTQCSYDFLLHLLRDLGLEVSVKKLVPPSTKVVCLGVEIDTQNIQSQFQQKN